MRSSLAIFVVGVFVGVTATYFSTKTSNAGEAYLPKTDSEKALDTLLTLNNRDRGAMFNFVLHHPWRDKAKDACYQDLFTPEILHAFAQAEREALQVSCGGKYIEGDLCGLGVSPITCSQDPPELFAYQTLSSNDHDVTIRAIDRTRNQAGPTYRMVKIGKKWKLDGVDCKDIKFNE